MSTTRSWIQHRVAENGREIHPEYRKGVDAFLEQAFSAAAFVNGDTIRCPCLVCANFEWKNRDEVHGHLLLKGFLTTYTRWYHHGEPLLECNSSSSSNPQVGGPSQSAQYREMVLEMAGPHFTEQVGNDVDGDTMMQEEPNEEAKDFYNLLKEAEEPLYEGHEKHTRLSAISELLHYKTENGCTERGFNNLLKLIKSFLPENDKLPISFYETKKVVKRLGLGYERIDACEDDCILYYGDYKDLKWCPICRKSRYKPKSGSKGKDIPTKILRYFPIGSRLQRLYMSSKTSTDMRWHNTRTTVDGELRHPADGLAWKQFDKDHPQFGQEARNVRLGLACDGFCPFGPSSKAYSCWPVIMVPYNLPPWKCMKEPYMFLSLLIPGPKSPGKDLGVFLQPLIDELKSLWEIGLHTYDASLKDNFTMRAALMWTVNDFPALGMACSWSTHGSLACPICMDGNKAIRLKYGGKPSFFGSHRRFLPMNHRFRNITGDFYKEKERRSAPPRLSGIEILEKMNKIAFPAPGKAFKDQKIHGFGKEHNFTRHNVFYQLPYWKTNLLRHNLDVMHIEKNVFENVFNTVMDVPKKTKDNPKTRQDLVHMGIRQKLHPVTKNGKTILPKAAYTLTKEQIKLVCQWVKELKLPDGYASNISNCCNVSDCRFYGLKSHDCHVFMQRLIPIAFRDLLEPPIVDALTELCHFFRDLCSTVLKESDLKVLEKKIIETMSKLEMIFPPGFFDSMEHLTIHLAYEATLGGPVQYRWMYPFERCMRWLKDKVHNKARVEGSIAEMYVIEEIANFCSMYFENDKETKHNRVSRNEVQVEEDTGRRLSVFRNTGGRVLGEGRRRILTMEEFCFLDSEARTKICPIIRAFISEPWITWRQIPQEVKEALFLEYCATYKFAEGQEKKGKRIFMEHCKANYSRWMSREKERAMTKARLPIRPFRAEAKKHHPSWIIPQVWIQMCDKWLAPEHVAKCLIAAQNRAQLQLSHSGGSRPAEHHQKAFEEEHGRLPTPVEHFDRIYKKKGGKGDYTTPLAKEIADGYRATIESTQKSDRLESWIEHIGKKKNRVIGQGPRWKASHFLSSKYSAATTSSQGTAATQPPTLDMIKPLVFQAIYGPDVPYDPSAENFRSVIAYEVSRQLGKDHGTGSEGRTQDQDAFETHGNAREDDLSDDSSIPKDM